MSLLGLNQREDTVQGQEHQANGLARSHLGVRLLFQRHSPRELNCAPPVLFVWLTPAWLLPPSHGPDHGGCWKNMDQLGPTVGPADWPPPPIWVIYVNHILLEDVLPSQF